MKLAAFISLSLALLAEVATAGYLRHECKNFHIKKGRSIEAECLKDNGEFRKTSQDLNLCIKNVRGSLMPANRGNFYKTCSACIPVTMKKGAPDAWLQCRKCKGADGKFRESDVIDLSSFMENKDGYMWCFGHRSAPS